MKSSPIVNVISSAVSCVKPRFTKRGWSFDTTPLGPMKSWPCERPSKLVVPIIVHSSATVPGTGSSRGAPASGGRVYRTRSRQCSGASREKRLKYTANGSARRGPGGGAEEAHPPGRGGRGGRGPDGGRARGR